MLSVHYLINKTILLNFYIINKMENKEILAKLETVKRVNELNEELLVKQFQMSLHLAKLFGRSISLLKSYHNECKCESIKKSLLEQINALEIEFNQNYSNYKI